MYFYVGHKYTVQASIQMTPVRMVKVDRYWGYIHGLCGYDLIIIKGLSKETNSLSSLDSR